MFSVSTHTCRYLHRYVDIYTVHSRYIYTVPQSASAQQSELLCQSGCVLRISVLLSVAVTVFIHQSHIYSATLSNTSRLVVSSVSCELQDGADPAAARGDAACAQVAKKYLDSGEKYLGKILCDVCTAGR